MSDLAVENQKLKKQLEEYEQHLYEAQQNYLQSKKNFISSVYALASVIDARDPSTSGHSRRVTEYSLLMGHRLELPENDLENLEYMAILHDIGKIGVADAILYKAAALSEEEYGLLQQHVRVGSYLLADMAALKPLLPGLLFHHERYDGKGYVFGRAAKEIPLEARIIAIADAFDAMTSDRPHRKALSRETAMGILEKNKGTQFDPDLVDQFLDILKSGDRLEDQDAIQDGPQNGEPAADTGVRLHAVSKEL